MEFSDLLKRASTGGGVLFCGAGFSADCLNLSNNDELGTSAALLKLLNQELEKDIPVPYRELKNAADRFIELRGQNKLLAMLRDRFKVSHVTDEMIELCRFPWDRIYTTNYDNALQLACTRAGRNFKTLNNLDTPEAVPGSGIEVVHLHGCAEKWDIHNFVRSCVLGADSYLETDKALGHWTGKLQNDFDRARLFVFVGFAAGDFHLNRVFFNAREAHPKVFFVNRPAAALDPDLQMTQQKFGKPLSIGRSGLSRLVREAMQSAGPTEPPAPSYRKYERPTQAAEIPSVTAIRDLFIFGQVDGGQIVRDLSVNTADYHVLREATNEIITGIENGNSVTLVTGEICDGKSLIMEELCARLSPSRPTYLMKRPYETIVEETSSLIATHGNPVFLIENCFDLSSQRLGSLLPLFSGSRASLVLTSRSISARAEVSDFERLKAFESLQHRRLSRLNDREIEELVRLSDQIAGWLEFPTTYAEKLRFVRERCRGSLPAFLLELLRSEFVRDRYAEEYRKTIELCSSSEIAAVIAALYIAHIGHDAPLSLLSNIFRTDAAAVLDRFKIGDLAHGLHLIRVEGGYLKTVPSIGASRILREIVPTQNKRLVVDTVVQMLKVLSQRDYGDDFERRMFTQLMRYSILATVVEDVGERNRFFDNVSKIDHCRTQVLFWLQWHMAMVDQKRFADAETYLRRGYTEAAAYERRTGARYDLFQIEDRKAKFLMIRGRSEDFRVNMIHDLRKACEITERLLRRNDLTHHPFDTFVEIVEFFEQVGSKFDEPLRRSSRAMIERVGGVVRNRASLLDEGYPASRANRALDRFGAFIDV
jgi:SIR2-like domain